MKKSVLKCMAVLIVLSSAMYGCTDDKVVIDDSNVSEFFDVRTVGTYQKDTNQEDAKPLKGSATDGSVMKIKILKLKEYNLSSVSLSVEDSKFGLVSIALNSKSSPHIEDTNPTPKTNGSVSYYEYYYHAPTIFPASATADSIVMSNVKLVINVGDKSLTINRPIELIRTPIIFAHGLASDSTTFTPMIDMVVKKNLYKLNALYSLDYSATSVDHYNVNNKVVSNAIDKVQGRMHDDGYAVSKVNLVGHSMGGVLTRLYMQSGLYRGDIDKVITIDSPNSGSQGADLLVDLGERFPGTIFDVFAKWGAVIDLQVDSKATLEDLNGVSLNLVKLPSHAICATFGGVKQVSELIKDKKYFEALLVFGLGKFAENVYGESNDIVVPLSSQLGGVKKLATSQFSGQWHCSVHCTQETTDKVVELADKSSTSVNFTSEGFAPPKLKYVSILEGVKVENIVQNTTSKDTFVFPEAVKDAVIFAIDAKGKIVDAQYCENELKYTKNSKNTNKLYIVARATSTDKILCSSIDIIGVR